MSKRKLFDKKTDYAILVFVILAVLMLAHCERVDAAETSIEYWHDSNSGITDYNHGLDQIGPRRTFDTGASVYIAPIVGVGGHIDIGSFALGFGQRFYERFQAELHLVYYLDEPYGGFSVRRYIGDGPFKLAMGGSYWIEGSPGSDSEVTFNLGISYTWD